jgi:hypothetical protein
MAHRTVKIFDYVENGDFLTITTHYRALAKLLGLEEWSPVVWIGRLFCLDNDYGEHWFDTVELRKQREPIAHQQGIPSENIFVIDPERFTNHEDGPCHTSAVRKRFWTDVLTSFTLSYDLLCAEARSVNAYYQQHHPSDYIADLEGRITQLLQEEDAAPNGAGATGLG